MAWTNGSGRTATAHWQRLRTQALTRDHHTCQQFGDNGNQVDHITPHAEGGTDTLTKLQTLCTPCHKQKTQDEARRGHQRRKRRLQRPRDGYPGMTHPRGHPSKRYR